MSTDGIEAHVANRKPSLAAAQGLPSECLSPGYAESGAFEPALSVSALVEQCRREIQAYLRGEPSNGVYGLELLCRVLIQGDQDARAGIEQCLSELVRGWLYSHPRSEEALRWKSEESFVALAFERFWQATLQQQVAFRTLAGALIYLCASLNGALLDTLRVYSGPGVSEGPDVEDRTDSREVWEILQRVLPSEREQRMAYLLYHCGLGPREIMRFSPQEWTDVQEVYCLRRSILERLLHTTDELRWLFNLQEQI